MVGAVLGAALAMTGCRQRVEPVDRDVNVSHHQTARAGSAHHRPLREGRHHRPSIAGIRAGVVRDVPEPRRGGRRPPPLPANGCATVREPGHGVAVRCVQGSGEDFDRSHDAVLRGPTDAPDDDNED
ncbi:hypothetical protein GCM10023195_03750 [Actinoallomurus liliacearum]|uniref:Lipoprotein n=2 Tax=Thermomonosporaceae TaxID=2012 RepID=A0ABP8TC07_9ACTN